MKEFFFRHNRKHHARTNSVKNNLRDIFLRQMRMSDPEILSFICKSLHKKPKKPLPAEIMNLLQDPKETLSVNDSEKSEESDVSDEFEDSDSSDDSDLSDASNESDASDESDESDELDEANESDIPDLSDVSSDEIDSSETESIDSDE